MSTECSCHLRVFWVTWPWVYNAPGRWHLGTPLSMSMCLHYLTYIANFGILVEEWKKVPGEDKDEDHGWWEDLSLHYSWTGYLTGFDASGRSRRSRISKGPCEILRPSSAAAEPNGQVPCRVKIGAFSSPLHVTIGQQAVQVQSSQQCSTEFLEADEVWTEDNSINGKRDGGDYIYLIFCCTPRCTSGVVSHIQPPLNAYFFFLFFF